MAKKSTTGRKASKATREEMEDRLAAATTLTPEEIEDLFPRQADKAELLALLDAVRKATSENEAKAVVTARIGDFARVLVKVIRHIAAA